MAQLDVILSTLISAIALVIFGCNSQQTGSAPASEWDASSSEMISGTISLPEISGARIVNNRVIVVADDAVDENHDVRQFHMVAALDVERFLAGGSIEVREEDHLYRRIIEHLDPSRMRSDRITDLEAVASDERYLYLVSSHSRSQKDNYPAKRRRLVRLEIDGADIQSADFSSARLERILPQELQGSTERRPADESPGFNIEGMAVSPEGDLLFGLRSPLIEGRALILAADKDVLWENDREPVLEIRHQLNLGGLGIRAIERDDLRAGYWLIAGASTDVDAADNPWAIWFMTDSGELEQRWRRDDVPAEIRNPEALAVISSEAAGDHLLVISDNSDRRPSTYVLLPIPE